MRVSTLVTLVILSPLVLAWPKHPEWACDAEITREIRQAGDKQELVTKISLKEDNYRMCIIENDKTRFYDRLVCNIALREELPKSAYVDPSEFEALSAKHNFRLWPHSDVDVGASAEDSSPLGLEVFVANAWPNPDWIGFPASFDATIHMPFHMRSQSVSAGTEFVDLSIPPPSRVAIRCVAPDVLQEWDPVKAREFYVMAPPHGVNMKTKNPSSLTYAKGFVSTYTWIELGGVPAEPAVAKIPVTSLGRKLTVSSVVTGVGGTAIALLGLILWVVRSGATTQKGKEPSSGSKGSSSNTSIKAKSPKEKRSPDKEEKASKKDSTKEETPGKKKETKKDK